MNFKNSQQTTPYLDQQLEDTWKLFPMYEPKPTTKGAVILNEIISCGLVVTSPLFVLFYWIAYQFYDASLLSSALAFTEAPLRFLSHMPRPSGASVVAYLLWVLFQGILYIILPGPIHYGPRTPGGRRLPYKLNGLSAWAITVGCATVASYYRLIDPAWIAKNWGELLATANLYCFALIGTFYIKARSSPDNVEDTLLTGEYIVRNYPDWLA